MNPNHSRTSPVLGILGGLLVGLALPIQTAGAETAKDLAGTWTLVSAEEDGAQAQLYGPNPMGPYGPNPRGIMVVDATGHYAIISMRAELPRLASGNRAIGTPAENASVVAGSLAHFGTLTVDTTAGALILAIKSSTFPNWDGTTLRWPFTLTGDQLQFTVPAASGGGTAKTFWKRAH